MFSGVVIIMKQTKIPFIAAIALLGLTAGILAGFNRHWGMLPVFPLYGILIDICAVPVLIYMFIFARRMAKASTDEFSVTKKRMGAQVGFVIGFALFAVTGVIPLIFPQAYNAFIATLDGANEGFIMGRVFGMAPFVIGLLIGQVTAWLRYR